MDAATRSDMQAYTGCIAGTGEPLSPGRQRRVGNGDLPVVIICGGEKDEDEALLLCVRRAAALARA